MEVAGGRLGKREVEGGARGESLGSRFSSCEAKQ